MRLHKFMAHAGIASRRTCEDMIIQGRVSVNGRIVDSPGFKIDPENDEVRVGGKTVDLEKKVYMALHKPLGVISTMSDPFGRPTIFDLINDLKERLYPIGRLDAETDGLLILTNDGDLAHRLAHPSFEIPKTYIADVRGVPDEKGLRILRSGVELEDGLTAPAAVEIVGRTRFGARLRLTLHEGRKHEVRRMCAEVGREVVNLRRVVFAGIELGDLKAGNKRFLTPDEIAQLRQLSQGR
ncbi:pseudouridine synthase [Candidatus Hydrogenedentota bacterium]